MKRYLTCFSALFCLFFTACGSVENLSRGNSNITLTDVAVFLFGTDFASSGQIYTADFESAADLANTGVTGLGSSAVIRSFGDRLYVLHDGFSFGSSDNVQILDPADDLATINQWSTGNGTNPQDLVVIGNQAYITLYDPANDDDNVDGDGHPADLIVMNLDTGVIEKRISFFDFLNNDGSRNGRADCLVYVDPFLYVCLQDLDGDSFEHNTSGKIGVVNAETNEIEEVITLKGRNPVELAYSADEEKLYVALQAPFDFTLGNFDTSTVFGGLEIVPLANPANSVLIDDADLGGYIEKAEASEGKVFVVASEMDPATFAFTSEILSMPDDNLIAGGFSVFVEESSDVRDIAADSEGRLWVSRRKIKAEDGSASNPRVDVFDIGTGEEVGETMEPEVPVTSIAIGEI